jgi:hypothetical protein
MSSLTLARAFDQFEADRGEAEIEPKAAVAVAERSSASSIADQ